MVNGFIYIPSLLKKRKKRAKNDFYKFIREEDLNQESTRLQAADIGIIIIIKACKYERKNETKKEAIRIIFSIIFFRPLFLPILIYFLLSGI